MSETGTTTTRTLCACGMSTYAIDSICDLCAEEAGYLADSIAAELDNADWTMQSYREYDDDPYEGWNDVD